MNIKYIFILVVVSFSQPFQALAMISPPEEPKTLAFSHAGVATAVSTELVAKRAIGASPFNLDVEAKLLEMSRSGAKPLVRMVAEYLEMPTLITIIDTSMKMMEGSSSAGTQLKFATNMLSTAFTELYQGRGTELPLEASGVVLGVSSLGVRPIVSYSGRQVGSSEFISEFDAGIRRLIPDGHADTWEAIAALPELQNSMGRVAVLLITSGDNIEETMSYLRQVRTEAGDYEVWPMVAFLAKPGTQPDYAAVRARLATIAKVVDPQRIPHTTRTDASLTGSELARVLRARLTRTVPHILPAHPTRGVHYDVAGEIYRLYPNQPIRVYLDDTFEALQAVVDTSTLAESFEKLKKDFQARADRKIAEKRAAEARAEEFAEIAELRRQYYETTDHKTKVWLEGQIRIVDTRRENSMRLDGFYAVAEMRVKTPEKRKLLDRVLKFYEKTFDTPEALKKAMIDAQLNPSDTKLVTFLKSEKALKAAKHLAARGQMMVAMVTNIPKLDPNGLD